MLIKSSLWSARWDVQAASGPVMLAVPRSIWLHQGTAAVMAAVTSFTHSQRQAAGESG